MHVLLTRVRESGEREMFAITVGILIYSHIVLIALYYVLIYSWLWPILLIYMVYIDNMY